MSAELEMAQSRLDDFKRKHSPRGLLLRYCARRRANFLPRQMFTLLSLPVLMATGHWGWALLALLVVLAGEAVDYGFLSHAERRLKAGERLRHIYWGAAVTGAVHALSNALVVLGITLLESSPVTMTLCLAALTAGSINSAFDVRFHKGATYARLCVLLLAALVLSLIHFQRDALGAADIWYLVFAIAISAFTVNSFLSYSADSFLKQTIRERAALQQNRQIARVGQELANIQSETRKLALVAKHANDSVFIREPSGQIIWVNDAFTRMTGHSAADAIGATPADLLNGPNTSAAASDAISTAVAEGKPIRHEILTSTKDGQDYWVETNQVPIRDANGDVEMIIAIERDITAAKRHEAELDAAKHAAEDGERAKAQFLATMSHEIRTPMNGIIGMADLLSDTAMTREHRNYVDTIKYSAEALLRIINDILDFSKFDAGKSIIAPTDFNLLACIESALSILRPKALEKNIYIDLDCQTAIPELMRGDDGRIRQILINIVGNAIKFTKNGGVTLLLSSAARDDGFDITLAVKDTGIGIRNDQLSAIFDEFSQADGDITRKFGGTGLGLTISRILAREMGGDITVSSEEGQGSVFTITLRLEPALDETTSALEPESTAPIDIKLPNVKALVAEDNKTNQLLIKSYLKDTKMDVIYANNGIEAVKLAKRHGPRVIFMDMSMPEMDGIEATRAIRKAEMEQPTIIALTANVYASDKAACLNAGMDGFLSKPLKRSELMSCLSAL